MQVHVLTGDSLAENFPNSIGGEKIISRECLIEGALDGETLPEFWQTRAAFIAATYGETEDSYAQKVKGEYEKLLSVSPADTVNLWFEHDLFCQVNLWFTLYLLAQNMPTDVYRVMPTARNQADLWRGFGDLQPEELEKCLASKITFEKEDLSLGVNLWQAYKNSDLTKLKQLSAIDSACFPHLKEVCAAEIARKTERRPQKTLQKIVAAGVNNFSEIFAQFSHTEGIYGYGDLQVEHLLNAVTKAKN